MNRVVLWGLGNDYEWLLNHILFEIHKGNMSVEGIVCREKDKYCSFKDGFRIISRDELMDIDFDFVIITSSKYYKEIKDEAILLGIKEKQIIRGQIIKLPLFDFERYVSLIRNPVTILSDDCWGGVCI